MRTWKLVGLALAVGALPFVSLGTAGARIRPALSDEDLELAVDGIILRALGDGEAHSGSIQVLIGVGTEVLLMKSYGPLAPSDRSGNSFSCPPLLTPFLATAVLQQVEAGRMDLDDTVSDLLPEQPFTGPGIRLRHLLTHTSGLPDYGSHPGPNPNDILTWLEKQAPEADPGVCSSYSRTNELLLGLALERATEKPLTAHLQSNVFEPAQLLDTDFDGESSAVRPDWQVLFSGELVDRPGGFRFLGVDGLQTTNQDLFLWMRALVQRQIVGEQGFETLSNPPTGEDSARNSSTFAAGINVLSLESHPGLALGGKCEATQVQVAFYPGLELTIVLTSHGDGPDARGLTHRIARHIHDIPEPGVQDLPLTEEDLQRYIGVYQIGCNDYAIDRTGKRLQLTPPTGPPIELLHQGRHTFVTSADPGVRLIFDVQDDLAGSFELDEHGAVSVARRIG